jgi:hypothetical protein
MTTASTVQRETPVFSQKSSINTAALVAGLGLLVMVLTAPISELYVFPKLIVQGDAAQTVKHLSAERGLFVLGIFGYVVTFLADIVVAWALYQFLRPVHQNLSLLTALFRLVYSTIALVAIAHLATVYKMITTSTYTSFLDAREMNNGVMLEYYAFKNTWYFGILFFGIHLGVLGYLALRSGYIPKIFGVLLLLSALGYLATMVQPYLASGKRIDFAKYTFYGELAFMLWLLIKGWRLKPEIYIRGRNTIVVD